MFRSDVVCEPIKAISALHEPYAEQRYPTRTANDILLTELQATSMLAKEAEFSPTVVYDQYESISPDASGSNSDKE